MEVNIRKKTPHFLWRVVLPLAVGAFIYICGRNFFGWPIGPDAVPMPGWVKYNLPDGSWVFAFTNHIALIWDEGKRKNRLFWIFAPLFVAVVLECMPLFAMKGTFDLLDLLAYVAGFLGSVAVFRAVPLRKLRFRDDGIASRG